MLHFNPTTHYLSLTHHKPNFVNRLVDKFVLIVKALLSWVVVYLVEEAQLVKWCIPCPPTSIFKEEETVYHYHGN